MNKSKIKQLSNTEFEQLIKESTSYNDFLKKIKYVSWKTFL